MCNRYYLEIEENEDDVEELRLLMQALQRKSAGNAAAVKTGEISPTDLAPVIANNRRLVPTPFAMKWGYTLPVILPAQAQAQWLDIRSDGRDVLKSALTDMSFGIASI